MTWKSMMIYDEGGRRCFVSGCYRERHRVCALCGASVSRLSRWGRLPLWKSNKDVRGSRGERKASHRGRPLSHVD